MWGWVSYELTYAWDLATKKRVRFYLVYNFLGRFCSLPCVCRCQARLQLKIEQAEAAELNALKEGEV